MKYYDYVNSFSQQTLHQVLPLQVNPTYVLRQSIPDLQQLGTMVQLFFEFSIVVKLSLVVMLQFEHYKQELKNRWWHQQPEYTQFCDQEFSFDQGTIYFSYFQYHQCTIHEQIQYLSKWRVSICFSLSCCKLELYFVGHILHLILYMMMAVDLLIYMYQLKFICILFWVYFIMLLMRDGLCLGNFLIKYHQILQRLYFEMSKSSAQKSSVSVVSIPKKPEGPPPFDPARYATKNLSADDVLKLKQCFDVFDYDKSGNVSPDELVTAIKALGLEKDAGKILHVVTTQTDGSQMDFPAFLQIFGFSGQTNSQKSLQQLFEVFDKSGSGAFGVEQFTRVCEDVGERFTEAEIQQMIQYADKDGDGKINFNQFVEIVTKEYPTI